MYHLRCLLPLLLVVLSGCTHNLVADPGFEHQEPGILADPWSDPIGHYSVTHALKSWVNEVPADARRGRRSARMESRDGLSEVRQTITVQPATRYAMTAWVHTSPTLQRAEIGVQATDNGNIATLATQPFAASPHRYQSVRLEFDSGRNHALQIYVRHKGWTHPQRVDLDDVTVEALGPSPLFQGPHWLLTDRWQLLPEDPNAAPVTPLYFRCINRVVSDQSINNTESRWQVHGTDLGFVYTVPGGPDRIVFGDTFARHEGWRSNTLGYAPPTPPAQGLRLVDMAEDPPGYAKEILASTKVEGEQRTVIPTTGLYLDGRDYLHYMSIQSWGPWNVTYSGLAWSDDGGQHWTKDPHARWDGDRVAHGAMVLHEEHVYFFFMPDAAGLRSAPARLARVPSTRILDKHAYHYWDGSTWQPDIERAAVVVDGRVGELSVVWHEHFNRWMMTYYDGRTDHIVLREAQHLTGPWSPPRTLVTQEIYPFPYGGYIHPRFTGDAKLYTLLSQWNPYTVWFMESALEPNLLRDPSFSYGLSTAGPWRLHGAARLLPGMGYGKNDSDALYLAAGGEASQPVSLPHAGRYRLTAQFTTPSPDALWGVRTSEGRILAQAPIKAAEAYGPSHLQFEMNAPGRVEVFCRLE